MLRPLGALGLGMVLLSGCADLYRQPPATQETPVEQAGENPPESSGLLTDADGDGYLEDAVERPLPPLPARKPAVDASRIAVAAKHPETNLDDLVGLNFNNAKALLGDPVLRIEEPPAKIWAYNGRQCVLHLFFYPKVGGEDFRILTYKVKGGEDVGDELQDAFAEECLARMVEDAKPVDPEAVLEGKEAPSAEQ